MVMFKMTKYTWQKLLSDISKNEEILESKKSSEKDISIAKNNLGSLYLRKKAALPNSFGSNNIRVLDIVFNKYSEIESRNHVAIVVSLDPLRSVVEEWVELVTVLDETLPAEKIDTQEYQEMVDRRNGYPFEHVEIDRENSLMKKWWDTEVYDGLDLDDVFSVIDLELN